MSLGVQRPSGGAPLRMLPGEHPENPTREVVRRFNEAIANHDIEALRRTLSSRCSFHNSRLALDGERLDGPAAVIRHWEDGFRSGRAGCFTTEDVAVCGERALVRWMHTVRQPDGSPLISSGVDVLRVSGFRIVEKRSFAALAD